MLKARISAIQTCLCAHLREFSVRGKRGLDKTQRFTGINGREIIYPSLEEGIKNWRSREGLEHHPGAGWSVRTPLFSWQGRNVFPRHLLCPRCGAGAAPPAAPCQSS